MKWWLSAEELERQIEDKRREIKQQQAKIGDLNVLIRKAYDLEHGVREELP